MSSYSAVACDGCGEVLMLGDAVDGRFCSTCAHERHWWRPPRRLERVRPSEQERARARAFFAQARARGWMP